MQLQQTINRIAAGSNGGEHIAKLYSTPYSGRGMFGKQCPAITGTWRECQRFLAAVSRSLAQDWCSKHEQQGAVHTDVQACELAASSANFDDLIDRLWDFSFDQFGRSDIILYWPNEEWRDVSQDPQLTA